MKKQKTNKVKTVVYLIHFILIDIWARNGVLHIFLRGGCLFAKPQLGDSLDHRCELLTKWDDPPSRAPPKKRQTPWVLDTLKERVLV